MIITFSKKALSEFNQWAKTDEKIFSRIEKLIDDIEQNPYLGLGKPEPLKHNLSGCWSRRINKEHRLVYHLIDNETIEILRCRDHYD